MPALSLVICLYQEGDMLNRLLTQVAGCHDDLVVVHDGPESTGMRALVEAAGGRFVEAPRAFQQEPHWPLAWSLARHDWILRLDADEFPSQDMQQWLRAFRAAPNPDPEISGYTCDWPLWNGCRTVSRIWPRGRNFLFDRRQVRFFGMNEQTPVPDGVWHALPLTLHHQPRRKSYGLHNVLVRRQAYRWRELLARTLLGKPTDLNCWRWTRETWPAEWEQIRRHPLRTALMRLTLGTFRALRDQWRREKRLYPEAAIATPIHHTLVCLKYWRLRRKTMPVRPHPPLATSRSD